MKPSHAPDDMETIPGTRMCVDWPALVSAQNIVLDRLPDNFTESLRLGNGDIGVALYADPYGAVLSVAKNDLLDYRTKELAHSPEATAFTNAATPMPTTKPAGLIRFRSTTGRSTLGRVCLNLWDAEASVSSGTAVAPALTAFVSKQGNLLVITYHPPDGQGFDIELVRNTDTTGVIATLPEFGAEDRDIWVRYPFPPDPDTYPNGFEYVMMGRVLGGQIIRADIVPNHTDSPGEDSSTGWVAEVGAGFPAEQRRMVQNPAADAPATTINGVCRVRMDADAPVTVLIAVMTTRDNPDPLQAARAELDAAQHTGATALREVHSRLWHDFWKRSFVQLAGRDYLNQQWFLSLYHLASATAPGRVGPGLFGPWTWEDFPPWGNDRHWDYNVQATLWGAYSCNHLELTQAYNDEIFDLLPAAKMMVRDYYGGIPGAKFPGVGWPRKYTTPVSSRKSEFTSTWVNGFVAQPLWWYYQYSQDTVFLRDKGYPVIKACAEFYEHFVEHAPDGMYDMPPTAVWDLAFMIPDAKNATIDLAFAKILLRIAVAASEVLDVDADRRDGWTQVADNLRDYATTVIDGKHFEPVDHRAGGAIALYTSRDFPSGTVLVAYEDYPVIEYNLPAVTMPIFPSGEIGMHSASEQRDLALRTLQITPYYLWDDLVMLTMAWVRLGCDQLDVFEKHSRAIQLVNGCQTYPSDCWASKWVFTHFFGWPVVVNESIVQSYTGVIRIAPVKLKDTAYFAGLRTEGAFLVSGEISSGGRVSYLAITSEAGAVCKLGRPWDERGRVRLLTGEEIITFSDDQEVLVFPSIAGNTYVVERLDAPPDLQPMTVIGGKQT
ncbi:MAG: hypothetical protein FJY97_06630 [candidate division Zixibacteria bacterium]|nr:hypothetical protein [candidate division Zixibacteria bacterium]